MKSLADKIIAFNKRIHFSGTLPKGIRMMNPFRESAEALRVSSAFYQKFYNDNLERKLILGINPGRFGAGSTGIPFTDPKRLVNECGIPFNGTITHEPSSVFIYEMIAAYGGVEKFYKDIYISSLSPLGFTAVNENGKELNYNYYDSAALEGAVHNFMIGSIKTQLEFGLNTATCFCLGTGKNHKYLRKINDEHGFFKKIVALEHPRYIMQYKSASKQTYIDKYLEALLS